MRPMSQFSKNSPTYQHFILLLWQERNGQGKWRISLLDPKTEVRTGFKNLEELTVYLKMWMETSPTQNSKELN